jgi:ABC-type sugar transport system ATPase subunit
MRKVMNSPMIEAEGLSRAFGHVQALSDASITVTRGEVVAIVGDNGAGKSTLMKILCGAIAPDTGSLTVDGSSQIFRSVRDAQAIGIEAVYQNLSLAPDLTIPEAIFLGREILSSRFAALKVLDRHRMADEAAAALKALGISLPKLEVPVGSLSGGQRQAVAVARAIRWASNVLLMDEPTAALGVRQSDIVTNVIRAVATSGLAVVVISHDMPRMLQTADRIVVMRHGATVADLRAEDTTIPDIVAEMLGVHVQS